MMYLSSIHNKVGAKENDYIQQHNSFVKAVFEEMDDAMSTANELIEFNIFTEDAGNSLGTTIVNGIRKIGEKIIEMLHRIKEFISDAIDKIKSDIYNSKSDEQKLKDFIRKYPDKAKDIKSAVSRGELAFPSYRDLNDFYANIDQILLDIKKGQIDPNSLRGRWEALKTKFNDNEKLIKNTSAVLGIVVTAAGAYYSLNKFVFERNRYLREAGDAKKSFERLDQHAKAMTDYLSNASTRLSKNELSRNMSNTKLINDMITECNKYTCGSFGSYMKLDRKFFNDMLRGCKTTDEKITALQSGIKAAQEYGNQTFRNAT